MADSQAILSYLSRRQAALNRTAIQRAALRTLIGCAIIWFDSLLCTPLLSYFHVADAQQIVDLCGLVVILEGAYRLATTLYYYLYVPREVSVLSAQQRKLLHVPPDIKPGKGSVPASTRNKQSLVRAQSSEDEPWRRKLASPDMSIFSPAVRLRNNPRNYCIGSLNSTVVTPPYNSILTSPNGKSYTSTFTSPNTAVGYNPSPAGTPHSPRAAVSFAPQSSAYSTHNDSYSGGRTDSSTTGYASSGYPSRQPSHALTSPRTDMNSSSVFSPLGSPAQSPKMGRVADRRGLQRLMDTMLDASNTSNQTIMAGGQAAPHGRGYMSALPTALGQIKDGIKYFLAARPTVKQEHAAASKDDLQAEQVWDKLGLGPDDRFVAADRCQMWITRHVLRPLAQEFDRVNTTLKGANKSARVGETGLSTLEKTNKADIPQLKRIMPYLRLHDNQYYLVARIRALAAQQGFAWSGGGRVTTTSGETLDYKPEFPTDVEILFHCLCCHLDDPSTLYIPSAQDVIAAESRSFTSIHVVKTPDDANDIKKRPYKSDIYLHMTQSKPPHFKLLVRVDDKLQSWDIEAGRNNFFLAFAAMLRYVAKYQGGMMDNYADQALDRHGLRLLQIVDV
eukprot:TRINITY_DN8243_c0_g1_i2.p1 TRINITY_DN8243_c0_g1~~TRINITY_DN8243_c0_g1_i2.p1  ORF type:complete len:618 (+),score=137.37 TRINITY_DN8243_c0_g1_i2:27-1880(+)